jgi:hypothetical protein
LACLRFQDPRQDEFGRIPLRYGVTSGKTWNDGIKELFERYPARLRFQDPETGLSPCLQLHLQSSYLTTIYLLLLETPVELINLVCHGMLFHDVG